MIKQMVGKVQARGGATVAGAVLLAVAAGGVGTAAVVAEPDTRRVSDETVFTPQPAAPTESPAEPPVADAPAPGVDERAAAPAPATVEPMTEPAPAPAPTPETIPAPQLNPDGSLPEGWLPPQNPGEPPAAPDPGPAPAPKLPGELGYVPPAGD